MQRNIKLINQKERAFTLVELLAVIVILAIILAVAVPGISSIINSSKASAMESNVKILLSSIKTKLELGEVALGDISADTLGTLLDYDNKNIQSITVQENAGQLYIQLVGKGEWEGYSCYGTPSSLTVSSSGQLIDKYSVATTDYTYTSASTQLAIGDCSNGNCDDVHGTINLNFSFPFGDTSYSTIYVGSNGLITFDENYAEEYDNENLNAGSTYPVIAVYWTDLYFNTTYLPNSGIYYDFGTENDKKYVLVEYRDVLNLNYDSEIDGASGNFEVKLYDDGTIKMSFADATYASYTESNGGDATVAVAVNRSNFSQYSYMQQKINNENSIIFETSPQVVFPGVVQESCFSFDTSTGTITGYDSTNCPSDVTIPEKIGGVTVKAIGQAAFAGSIESQICFKDSDGDPTTFYSESDFIVTSVADNYVHTGSDGYDGCIIEVHNDYPITSVVIPNTVTSIGTSAFADTGLTNVIIPDSVTYLGDTVFDGSNLQTVTIGNSVQNIGIGAFAGNHLTNVVIPDSVKSVAYFAFGQNQITSLTMGSNLETIGIYAFTNNQISTINWGSKISIIGATSFMGNQMESINFPNTVTQIGNYAFAENPITNFALNEGLTTIRTAAFGENLETDLNIPSTVTLLDSGAFYGSSSLSTITVSASNTSYKFVNNALYTFNGTTLLLGLAGAANSIENTTTTIADYAFAARSLTGITIPTSVTTIGKYAFSQNQLTSITLPSNVTKIDDGAFEYNQLTTVTIPSSVTYLSGFGSNLLTRIDIPNNVTTIGEEAFRSNKILQGDATVDNTVGNVAIGTDAFVNNGADGVTTITPVYLR